MVAWPRWMVLAGLLSCGVELGAPPRGAGAAEEPADRAGEAPRESMQRFLRLVRSAEGTPTRLETSIVTYTAEEGEVRVELVSAVHLGERAYYEALNEAFQEYDVVLYELVAPRGTRPPRGGGRSDQPLALLQGLATDALDLASQTAAIDYQAENFVHADLSPEEIAETLRRRGEDPLTTTLRVAADLLQQQNLESQREAEREAAGGTPERGAEAFDPLSLLLDPNAPRTMKRAMAEQFAQTGGGPEALGPTLNQILIEDRNGAALKVLQQQLAKGKKKIAIFYGAAHMPHFEQKLLEDFGLRRGDSRWITAWDLERKPPRAGGLFGR